MKDKRIREFVDKIAPLVLHQCWCSYQLGCGQSYNLVPTEEQLKSLKDAINTFLRNPMVTPEEMHRNWMNFKIANGWLFGLAKDESLKYHPNLVDWKYLNDVEKKKDTMHIEAQRFMYEIAKMVNDEKEEKI